MRGSSPRVRGEVRPPSSNILHCGIIPAGAGRRARTSRWRRRIGDHPRGCGEKIRSAMTVPTAVGSSPRVRGEGFWRGLNAEAVGIIPAGAGRRPQRRLARGEPQDHPRGCGEKGPRGQ